jgi:hypothetical protein
MGKLKTHIQSLLSSFDSLIEEIKSCEQVEDDLIHLLKELFIRKVHHFLVFDLLLRSGKQETALEWLKDYYLVEGINLKQNNKDHVEDLEIFFCSIVDDLGELTLVDFLNSKEIDVRNLTDPRVLAGIEFALDLDDGNGHTWVERNIETTRRG